MIPVSVLEEICAFSQERGVGEEQISELRKQYSDYHFTFCFDDDVSALAKPWASYPTFNIYLVNSSDHCSKLSNDAASASGVVLAEVIPDDD